MWTFFYFIILAILPFADLTRRQDNGCHEEIDLDSCWFNQRCFNYVDFNCDQLYENNLGYRFRERMTNCHSMFNIDSNKYVGVNLWFESDNENIIEIPNTRNYDTCVSLIVNLHLINYTSIVFPDFAKMENLRLLNVSHNRLTFARLFNSRNLQVLRELDMSYNQIMVFEEYTDDSFYPYRSLIKLNLTHNSLSKIPDNIFQECSKLNTLDVSYNFIDNLNMNTFEGITHLENLYLSHNEITDVNASLFRFHELKVLDLSHNNIENIRTADFIALEKLETLDLSYNFIKSADKSFLNAMTFLNSINLRNNLLKAIDIQLFLNNSQLAYVDLDNNSLVKLPKGLFKDKNISVFTIKNNKLEGSLVMGMFEGLKLVSTLDLSYQYITSIEDNAFFRLDNLYELLLNNNNISSLSKKAFISLQQLNRLDLSDNKIVSINFENDDLISLRFLSFRNNLLLQVKHDYYIYMNNLQFLDLANNNITTLEPESFSSLQNLISFEIFNNPLRGALEEGTFNGFGSLPLLDISGTKLTVIKNNSFSGMVRLRYLNASHGDIKHVAYNFLANTGIVESIDLSFNKIEIFLINTTHVSSLTMLLLNDNLLKVITSNDFKGLYYLTTLKLARNDILTIDNNCFYDQNNLLILDLSYNLKLTFNGSLVKNNNNLASLILSGIQHGVVLSDIVNIPVKDLSISDCGIKNIDTVHINTLPHLENIVLNNNKIVEVTVNAFSRATKLMLIDLSFNNITFIQPGAFKANTLLYSLNVSHNLITSLSYGVFRGLSYLNVLDLSYNSISDLKSERLYELKQLTFLIADHNKIESINAQDFNGTNLNQLSIGENPLPCDILVNFIDMNLTFNITALKMNEEIENLHGITCNKIITAQKPTSNTDYNKLSVSTKILLDIRDVLSKLSNGLIKQKDYDAPSNNIGHEFWKNVTDYIYQSNVSDKEKYLSFVNISSLMAKETNNTNILLQQILKTISLNDSMKRQSTSIPQTKEDNTGHLIPDIDKLKKDFEGKLASERQMINDLETKLSSINSRLDAMVSPPLNKNSVEEKGVKEELKQNKNDIQSDSVFTKTCVALILVIIVCYVLFKLYKSKVFVRPQRSFSTRELPVSMESQHF